MSAPIPDLIAGGVLAGRKRPLEVEPHSKKLRSKIPRRKRDSLVPIVAFDEEVECSEATSSCFDSELSLESGIGFVGSEKKAKGSKSVKKQPVESFTGDSNGDGFRRITRSYARKKNMVPESEEKMKDEKSGAKISEPAVSEITVSGVTQLSGVFPDENLKKDDGSSVKTEKYPEISESVSYLEAGSEVNNANATDSTADQSSKLQIVTDLADEYDLDLDLTCSEQLSNYDDDDDESSEYSTCNEVAVSEYDSDLFRSCSVGGEYYSDYSLSSLFDSPENFSEKSDENAAPSANFTMFHQLMEEFIRSTYWKDSKPKQQLKEDETSQEFILVVFEDEEDEESYKRLRSRERNEVVLYDFAEDYSSRKHYGDLILQQRLVMVNWMVERSEQLKLNHETLFLGVSIMDRFLSRGHFESERNLQLLGIASLTLATRLEENQPYNSIRQKSFNVGSSIYTRCEVVAMEWLLLEVFNFQCFLPTTHNFLWFYLKAANANEEVEKLCRYLAIISLLDHERLGYWPSTVAAGLVILACLAKNRDDICDVVMETHVRTKTDDLPDCIQSLEWLVEYAC